MSISAPFFRAKSRIVMKFGGTSMGVFSPSNTVDIKAMETAALLVQQEIKLGHEVVVVVSALSKKTDWLVGLFDKAKRPGPIDDVAWREYDVLLATGEQQSAAMMALHLQKFGIAARSLLAFQLPLRTTGPHGQAKIKTDLAQSYSEALKARLFDNGGVCVTAGFQGISETGDITTLGRGGSDASAVALAAMIDADRCDIYTDVDGIYTADPRLVPSAQKIGHMSYRSALALSLKGAKVLQSDCVVLAQKLGVPIQVLKTSDGIPGSQCTGTNVTKNETLERLNHDIIGVAHSVDTANNQATVSVIARHFPQNIMEEILGVLRDDADNPITPQKVKIETKAEAHSNVSSLSVFVSRKDVCTTINRLHQRYVLGIV